MLKKDMRFFRLKPCKTVFFNGCRSKTEVSEQLYYWRKDRYGMKRIRMIMGRAIPKIRLVRTFGSIGMALVISVFFLSASVWEGIARIVPVDEFSEKRYAITTNSFPPNTVVEVTNLENGRAIQAIIISGLESSGFLAAFSRDTAAAIGARSQSLVRIKITKISDPGAFSRLTEEVPSPRTETANNVEEKQKSTALSVVPQSIITNPGTQDNLTGAPKSKEPITQGEIRNEGVPDTIVTPPRPEEKVSPELSFNEEFTQSPPPPLRAVPPQGSTDPEPLQGYDLILIPAEERPPVETADAWILPPEAEIAPVSPLPIAEFASGAVIDPALIIPSPEDRAAIVSPVQEPSPQVHSADGPFFSVPVITSLEPGQYYLQLGAFGIIELVEAELSRIGGHYPLVIQPGENSQTPIYRILLGPVNLGESGALIQQFKSLGYEDAFIRQGSN
jgi:hypothetical protein